MCTRTRRGGGWWSGQGKCDSPGQVNLLGCIIGQSFSTICLSVCPFCQLINLSISLPVSLSECLYFLSVHQSLCLPVCLSVRLSLSTCFKIKEACKLMFLPCRCTQVVCVNITPHHPTVGSACQGSTTHLIAQG